MKPHLKPLGNERLKLRCDDPLSSLAFNFNLRRYNADDERARAAAGHD